MKLSRVARTLTATIGGLTMACGTAVGPAPAIPDSPDGTVKAVAQGLAGNHPEIVWQAMPESYRQDATEVIHQFATTVDPEIYNKAFELFNKAVRILQEKRDIILSSKMLDQAKIDRARLEQKWDSVLGILETFATSDLSTAERLKALDPESFLETTGQRIMTQAAQVSTISEDDPYQKEFLAKVNALQVEVVSSEGDSATLKITVPDEPAEEIEMTRVEGRWIPAEMAREWKDDIAEAKEKLARMSEQEKSQTKMQAMMMFGMVEAFLDQLGAVQTAEELDATLSGIFGGFLGSGAGNRSVQGKN